MALTMPYFSEFAAEIRLDIWQKSMTPRVVRANWPASEERFGSKGNPVLLFVNHESRAEVLKRYEKLPGNHHIYVDLSQDTIFMDSFFRSERLEFPEYNILDKQEPNIQILAIDHEYWIYYSTAYLQKILRCTKLRKLVIVMPGHETHDYNEDDIFYEPRNLITFQNLDPSIPLVAQSLKQLGLVGRG